jgi:ATP-binding cassette subfamily C protein LapB
MQLEPNSGAPRHPAAHGVPALDLFRPSSWVSPNQVSILAGTIVINLLALVLPLVILQAYDRILPNQSKSSLMLLAGVVVVALLVEALLRISRAHLVAWTGSSLVHNLRCEAVTRLVNTRSSDREEYEPGAHLERLSAIGTLKDHNTAQFVIAIVDLPFALLFLGLIAYIAWPLVFVPLVIFAALVAMGLRLGQKLKAVAEERTRGEERRHAFVVEVLSGVHTVKALGMEALMNRRYERLVAGQAGITHGSLRLGARAHEIGAAASQLTIVGVSALGAVMIMEGSLSIGALVACALLAGRALHPLLQGLGFWSQFQNLRVTAKRAAETVALLEEAPKPRAPKVRLRGSLVAKNVSFAHPGSREQLFTDVDLAIAAGEIVAVGGEGGSGKSTLLRLLGSMLPPTAGEILYDGTAAARISPNSLRAQIAFVPHQSVLFRGTLLENLTGFRDGPTVEAALAIGAALGLDEKVALLPEGLDTRVGEIAAEALPPGMRQQIALVRAFAIKPAIVLLDDAGANLDGVDEARLCDFLISLQRRTTIIFATHSAALGQLADRRLRIADKAVVELRAGDGQAGDAAAEAVHAGAP